MLCINKYICVVTNSTTTDCSGSIASTMGCCCSASSCSFASFVVTTSFAVTAVSFACLGSFDSYPYCFTLQVGFSCCSSFVAVVAASSSFSIVATAFNSFTSYSNLDFAFTITKT